MAPSWARTDPKLAVRIARPVSIGGPCGLLSEATAHEAVLSAGGTAIGEVVKLTTPDGREVTWAYVADPEGNAIELQSWS